MGLLRLCSGFKDSAVVVTDNAPCVRVFVPLPKLGFNKFLQEAKREWYVLSSRKKGRCFKEDAAAEQSDNFPVSQGRRHCTRYAC